MHRRYWNRWPAHGFTWNVATCTAFRWLWSFRTVANAPIGPLIMVTELSYGLLAPLMLASALCISWGVNFLFMKIR